VATTVNGVTTSLWTVYDGVNPYLDFNGSGNLTARYLEGLGIDQLFAKADASGNVSWYLTDMLGSVRQVVNSSATVLDQVNYDSFGNILSESNPANGDRFKFTGRELDTTTGLQYHRARFLMPQLGRWANEDPSRFGGADANLFRYANNTPTTFVDVTGLAPFIGPWFGIMYSDSLILLIMTAQAQAFANMRGAQASTGFAMLQQIMQHYRENRPSKFNPRQKAIIEKIVSELGDQDFKAREAATRDLLEHGADARPEVAAAADSKDPEVRRRARAILEEYDKELDAELRGLLYRLIPIHMEVFKERQEDHWSDFNESLFPPGLIGPRK
jgi:RHS repeat-associated protein